MMLRNNYETFCQAAQLLNEMQRHLEYLKHNHSDTLFNKKRQKKKLIMDKLQLQSQRKDLEEGDQENFSEIQDLMQEERQEIENLNLLYKNVRGILDNGVQYYSFFQMRKNHMENTARFPVHTVCKTFLELEAFAEKLCQRDPYSMKLKRKEKDGYYREECMLVDFFRSVYAIKDDIETRYRLLRENLLSSKKSEMDEQIRRIDEKIQEIEKELSHQEENYEQQQQEEIEKCQKTFRDLIQFDRIDEHISFEELKHQAIKPFGVCNSAYCPSHDQKRNCASVLQQVEQYDEQKNLFHYPLPFRCDRWMSVHLEYNDAVDQKVAEAIQSLICCICAGEDPYSKLLQIIYVDPLEKAADLGIVLGLDGLPSYYPRLRVIKEAGEFMTVLDGLEEQIERMTKQIAGYHSVFEYNEELIAQGGDKERIPMTVLIMNNFSVNYESAHWQKLSTILESSQRCGIHLLFLENTSKKGKVDEKIQEWILQNAVHIVNQEQEFFIGKTSFSLSVAARPNQEYQAIYEELSSQTINNDLLNYLVNRQVSSAISHIQIPFAVDSMGGLISLNLGSSLSPHALISGTTGCGKSTALHTIIQGIAASYSSDEVELWLIDYKINEFAQYIPQENQLPHIKMVGLQKTKNFSFGLLDELELEQKRRTELFFDNQVSGYEDYCRIPDADPLPRLMVIIDEFHVLSQHISDDLRYKQKLENLLSESRSVGITFLFSDQSVQAGLRGFTEKGKQQVTTRLAMNNSKAEMKDTLMLSLSQGNYDLLMTDMAQGEIIVRQKVRVDGNEETQIQKGKVLYADKEAKRKIMDIATANCRNCLKKEVVIVRSAEKARFDQTVIDHYLINHPEAENTIPLYLGVPASFEECFRVDLKRGAYQNLLVVSNQDVVRKSLLYHTINSFQKKSKEIFVFADKYDLFYQEAEDVLNMLGLHAVTEYSDICQFIETKLQSMETCDSVSSTLLVWFGLDAMFEEFSMMEDKGRNKFGASRLLDFTVDMTISDSPVLEEEAPEKDHCYNASNDLLKLFFRGTKNRFFSWTSFDCLDTLSQMRIFKKEYFKNLFLSKMTNIDAHSILGYSVNMDEMNKEQVLFSSSVGDVEVFLPYEID